MPETPLQVTTRLYAKLHRRRQAARKWGDAYEGKRPLLFLSPEFSMQTGGLFDEFADNWCAVVPDATVERLMPHGFRLEDGSIDSAAGMAWRRSEADVEVGLALLDALITGRSYALVWRNAGGPEITFQNAGQAVVEYVPGRRRLRRYGLMAWRDWDTEFATLFTPDMAYRWQRPARVGGRWTGRTAGLSRGEPSHIRHPLGAVPLVELPNRHRLHGKPRSEMATVLPLQDAVNSLWAHLMTASDGLALPARAVLGMDRPVREITDATGEVVGEEDLPLDKFRSDRLLWLEKEGAQIGEFSAADLDNYLRVIAVAVEHIAAQTRTPPSYLAGTLINVSPDGVAASEAGLVAKVTEKQRHFGSALREIMRLEALAQGEARRAESLALGSVVWRDPQFRSDAQYSDALVKLKSIGVPDEALWERIPGVTPDEIERWKQMRTDAAGAILGGDMSGLFGVKPDQGDDGQGDAPEMAA
ncbi:phage portal protein [Streptomyces sp. NBC_00102]|uniref:phage portal protein n=1 Tax=Streptomyces sp. NBC_00102 TaxID=2975652 RepID=UPI00224DCE04|nr:phage portal protein [Streptomyces sp. NBC_00102]MCX5398460.1 phage portal protein [Streptomyces sp. NBC_00102]